LDSIPNEASITGLSKSATPLVMVIKFPSPLPSRQLVNWLMQVDVPDADAAADAAGVAADAVGVAADALGVGVTVDC
jgi:hypothetical protein